MPEVKDYDYRRMSSSENDSCGDGEEHLRDHRQRPAFWTGHIKTILGVIGWMITTSLLIAILLQLRNASHLHMSHANTMGNESPYKDTSSPYKDESSRYKDSPASGGSPSPSHAESWPKCGSTPAEAKSLGCKFDILSFAWQLPACYDEKIMEEFLAEKDWVFYRAPNGTSPVSRDVALQGELDLFVTQEYHRTHCMYMWRQMHRAFTIQKHIDSHLNDYYHTLHCHHVMLGEQIPADAVGAVGTVKYPACQQVS